MNRFNISLLMVCALMLFKTQTIFAQQYSSFQNPVDNEVRPRVWWHWMNGNITKEGIYKDLMWMHRSGIGGAHCFDAGLVTPQIVKKRLTYMTPEWKDAFRYAAHITDSLGMELATAASPGWSQSGGPWVPLKDGMKKLVWREIRVNGGRLLKVKMPDPFDVSCEYQNAFTGKAITTAGEAVKTYKYYQDINVLAYRIAEDDLTMTEMKAKITSSNGHFTVQQLSNQNLGDYSQLAIHGDEPSYLNVEFPEPQTIKGITLTTDKKRDYWSSSPAYCCRSLEVSDDNISYRKVVDIPDGGVYQQTVSFPAVKARFFRVVFHKPNNVILGVYTDKPDTTTVSYTGISELILHTAPYINHGEEKAAFYSAWDIENFPTPDDNGVTKVVDITDKMDANGNITWNVPKGKWKILRFGYSLTGKQNGPASPEATGLEVDKMDAQAVTDYFNTYLDMYKDASGGKHGLNGLDYLVTDSYEAEQETWTRSMMQEFEHRRGYSIVPWMPVLTGQVVKNVKESEQFLWDWRKTIGELEVENYYETLDKVLAQRGMKRYSESQENGRVYMADGMAVKRHADIPMAAMWVRTPVGGTDNYMSVADIRESASVSHLYGQKIVAAESFTTMGMGGYAWAFGPEQIKPTADLEFACGLNRIVVHTSVHQPVDDKVPGLGLMIFGQWFNRHETWAEQAKTWTDYLARTSYMMQQGEFVADIAYYYGEDNNITGLITSDPPVIPSGYNYDYVNADALLNILVADGSQLKSTKTGTTYRILALDRNCNRMSLPVLRKLDVLSRQGVLICGDKPTVKAELQGSQAEFDSLATDIWNRPNVCSGRDIGSVLKNHSVNPDFTYTTGDSTEMLFVHHTVDDGEFYWVNSRADKTENAILSFRISGKKPEIWHAETGVKEAASYQIVNGRTNVNVTLSPHDAVFIVFHDEATESDMTYPKKTNSLLLTLQAPWQVKFQANRGAPAEVTFNQLVSYTDNSNEGIKYFSGAATYLNRFKLTRKQLKNDARIILDLGEVHNLAEVTVNGRNLGVVWKTPFRIDMTDAVKKGDNNIEVKVVNLWPNRLIGDLQPGVKEKITYTAMPFYQSDSPLQKAGLLGPVKIFSEK
jgi:hypothetical protein